MPEYEKRDYRDKIRTKGLISFNVVVKETDLWVSSDRDLKRETGDLVLLYRYQLENYIQSHPEFLTSLQPYPDDILGPPLVREMINATGDLGVGPMASVAGAIAQYVGKGLLESTGQVIVENGGDIFLKVKRPVTVSVFAGESPLSGKIGIKVLPGDMPMGVCSSSGRVGHSLSMGSTDVICLLSPSAARADGAATALGNRVKTKRDLEKVADQADEIEGIIGGLAIMGDRMTAWGDIELVEFQKAIPSKRDRVPSPINE